VQVQQAAMVVVWGGLGDGIDTKPVSSWLLLEKLELLCE
jgi:hypothetical protein